MKTYSARPSDVTRKWCLIDADGLVLGRLAVVIANRLRGKHKTTFTPHIDTGDNVIVVNAEKVKMTGRKLERKVYPWHSSHPGGLKLRSAKVLMAGPNAGRVVELAVERMMPKDSPLARKQMKKLKIYSGPAHPHEAQSPEALDVASRNPKNKR